MKSLIESDISFAKDSNRSAKVAREIYKSCALCIKLFRDPRLQAINITRVLISRDLKQAKVFFILLTTSVSNRASDCAKLLNKNSGIFRGFLAKRVVLRVMPHLKFYYDTQASNMQNLFTKLDSLNLDK